MIYRPERDTDPSYLLGRFDARRMIRLEGAPAGNAAGCAASFVEMQRRWPSVDRNITYLTWSVQMSERGRPGLRAGATNSSWPYWASTVGDSARFEPPMITLSGEYISLAPDAQAAFLAKERADEVVALAEFPEFAQRLQRARELVDLADVKFPYGGSDFSTYWRHAGAHEHGHTLWFELGLSDQYLETDLKEEMFGAIREVVPDYEEDEHQFSVLNEEEHRSRLPWLKAPLVAALCDQGIGRNGWENTHELIAEGFAMYARGYSTPLIDAIGTTMDRLAGRYSAHRIERQKALIRDLEWLLPEPLGPEQSTREPDRRFALFVDRAELDCELSGTANIAQLHDRSVEYGYEPTPEAIEACRVANEYVSRQRSRSASDDGLALG